MKTLLFTLEYPPFHGGVANYYGNLVKYWPEPHDIFVLDNNDGRLIKKSWPVIKWLPAIFKLRKAVQKNRIDHIIVGQILPLGLVSLIYCRFSAIKYSVILHGMDFGYAVKVWRKKILTKMILTRAQNIVCANTYTAKLVESFLENKVGGKISIVNPGINNLATRNSQLATQLKTEQNLYNKIILLSVGRLVKRKGFDKVIEAMPKVLEKIPNLVYVIIGEGEESENFKFKISNLKLNNNVLMIKSATDDERDAWYNVCDVFIMPSRNINGDFEGFGMVYLEANLAGKPVIAGLGGGMGDAVINGQNGLLVDGENIEDIKEKIIKLALDPELRIKLGQQGRERATHEFSWPKQVEKIYNLLSPFNKGAAQKGGGFKDVK